MTNAYINESSLITLINIRNKCFLGQIFDQNRVPKSNTIVQIWHLKIGGIELHTFAVIALMLTDCNNKIAFNSFCSVDTSNLAGFCFAISKRFAAQYCCTAQENERKKKSIKIEMFLTFDFTEKIGANKLKQNMEWSRVSFKLFHSQIIFRIKCWILFFWFCSVHITFSPFFSSSSDAELKSKATPFPEKKKNRKKQSEK